MTTDILYSFRRCPYAIRARWALLICKIKVELREVNLKNKPIDLTENSRNKTVPLLILGNGRKIEESLDIVLWAISKNKDENMKKNFFKDDYHKEIFKIIKENDIKFKYHLDRFKYSTRYLNNEREDHYEELLKILKKWNKLLSNSMWLIGNNQSVADWCIWPFVRQFKIACEIQKKTNYLEPHIKSWLTYFESHKNYLKVMQKYDLWEKSSSIKFFPFD